MIDKTFDSNDHRKILTTGTSGSGKSERDFQAFMEILAQQGLAIWSSRTLELEEQADEPEDSEAPVPVLPQCRNCKYLSCDLRDTDFSSYPCAVHPYGPNSENCSDWEEIEVSI